MRRAKPMQAPTITVDELRSAAIAAAREVMSTVEDPGPEWFSVRQYARHGDGLPVSHEAARKKLEREADKGTLERKHIKMRDGLGRLIDACVYRMKPKEKPNAKPMDRSKRSISV